MTTTYNVGAYPFSINCKGSCSFAGKDVSKQFKNANQQTFVEGGGDVPAMRATCKANAKDGRFIDWTGPLVPGLYHCQRCGTAHNVAGHRSDVEIITDGWPYGAVTETASQTGQAFDALQFLIECRDFKRGKWLTKHNGKSIHAKHTAAKHLREQNGMGKDASIEMVKRLSHQVECMLSAPVETKEDKAAQTLKFIQHISPPQIKPAPKAQAKPVPQTDGSIEVMDAALFGLLAEKVPVEIMEVTTVIEVETITINGVVFQNGAVFRCS